MSVPLVRFSSGLLKERLNERTELQSVSFSLKFREPFFCSFFCVCVHCMSLPYADFFLCVCSLHAALCSRIPCKTFITVHCLYSRMKVFFFSWSSSSTEAFLLELHRFAVKPSFNLLLVVKATVGERLWEEFKIYLKLVVNCSLSTVLCLFPISMWTPIKIFSGP